MLKATNWMPWKQQMLAVLHDLGLKSYITKDAAALEFSNPQILTKDKKITLKKWHKGDAKMQTRIELMVGNMEMVHLSGADTTKEMWDQLCMVKEAKGQINVLATCHVLYHMEANENSFDMMEHVSKLRRLQEELHLMDNKVNNKDFVMILLTSLPESWDVHIVTHLLILNQTATNLH